MYALRVCAVVRRTAGNAHQGLGRLPKDRQATGDVFSTHPFAQGIQGGCWNIGIECTLPNKVAL